MVTESFWIKIAKHKFNYGFIEFLFYEKNFIFFSSSSSSFQSRITASTSAICLSSALSSLIITRKTAGNELNTMMQYKNFVKKKIKKTGNESKCNADTNCSLDLEATII